MSNANRKKLPITAAAAAAAIAAAACTTLATSWAGTAQAAPARPATATMKDMTASDPSAYRFATLDNATPAHNVTVRLTLSPMPTGTVTLSDPGTHDLTIKAYGLTPGSAHTVLLHGNPVGTVTANSAGQLSATLAVNHLPSGAQLKILDGGRGTAAIAQTGPLYSGHGRYALHAVESGFPQGSLRGHATLVYDPAARTIAVTVTASGVSPGRHAAHIHVGSCQSQGPVQYMLTDFTADAHGNINNETRTVTNVTTPLPPTGWYLNLHQGNSNNILDANGNPTVNFRPLLCQNIVTNG